MKKVLVFDTSQEEKRVLEMKEGARMFQWLLK